MKHDKSASVEWSGNKLDFRASLGSGYEFDVSGGTEKIGGSPMELLLAGLAGCTAVDVVLMLQKQRQEISGLAVEVLGDRADSHPKVYTDVLVRYTIRGKGINPKAVERAIKLSEEKYCSASAMFSRSGAVIKIDYELIEEV
ncbi:MAG: OsmC family protein [Candidatus Promineifilaceae bacterium]|jgi:putative redox protein